ncbi:DedA family protein [Sphingomonas morindae]|uniref:DedA family protein n=1 Tax=Sphingomonas morindae TaxID=1541170 RepID=A0ABY4X6U0_9SPHN|nr:DedA family protein [Sphingomonas morindae]USI72616.1 DedA family protein [Sphingomonas morindae]
MHAIIEAVASWIILTISAAGYAGVALLMAIESACIPLPSEIIMPFAGYLVSIGRLELLAVATAGAIGCNLGSIPAYYAGKLGGRAVILRYGKWVLIGPSELDQAERFFARFGGLAVLIGRLLPVIRSFIAFPAGMARMNQLRFHLYTFIGSWPWCFALALVGERLGRAWQSDPRLRALLHKADLVVVAAIVAAIAFYIWHRMRGVRRAG